MNLRIGLEQNKQEIPLLKIDTQINHNECNWEDEY